MGQATIFNGQKIKTLKDTLTLNGKSDIISSMVDPTASAVDAPIGSLLINQTSGKLYRKLDAGSSVNWEEVGAGVGGINYILNPSAEVNTTGWATYADAAGTAPVDGTGGSPNVTWTRSTTSPLRGVADFNFVKDAANRQGQGVSYDFTIDEADKAKVLSVTFDYEVLSGTYADGDLTVYLIADPTGTPVVIQPAGYTVQSATVGTTMREVATFQTQATGTSYRLCFHVASTSASAYTLAIDNVVVGPQQTVQGAAISDWVSYPSTPVITVATGTVPTFSSVTGRYRRVGDSVEVEVTAIWQTATTFNSLYVGLPGSLKIDVSKLASPVGSVGNAYIRDTGITNYAGTVRVVAAFDDRVEAQAFFTNTSDAGSASDPTIASGITQVNPFTFASGDEVKVKFSVPISGWSSNTVLSQDTDTRVVAARAFSSTSGAWPTTDTVINFATVNYDTHSVITTGAGWNYRIPVSGYYKVSASHEGTSSGATTLVLRIRKNGSQFATGTFPMNAATSNIIVRVDGQNYFNAGDTIDITASSTAGVGTLVGSASASVVQIERLSGPATIAASETVAAYYVSSAGNQVTNGATNYIDFPTRVYDTHGMAIGTGSGNVTTSGTGFRVIIPVSGKYYIYAKSLSTFGGGWAVGEEWTVGITVNGTIATSFANLPIAAHTTFMNSQASGLLNLVAGDRVEIFIFQSSGAPLNMNNGAANNAMFIYRVGN